LTAVIDSFSEQNSHEAPAHHLCRFLGGDWSFNFHFWMSITVYFTQ